MRAIVCFDPSSNPGPWWKNTMTGNAPSPSGRTTWTPIGPLGVVISSVRVCIAPLLRATTRPERGGRAAIASRSDRGGRGLVGVAAGRRLQHLAGQGLGVVHVEVPHG